MNASAITTTIQTWAKRLWTNRATIRRDTTIAITHIIAITASFQLAFPQLPEHETAALATATRILTSLGVWLASAAVLRVTGEKTN